MLYELIEDVLCVVAAEIVNLFSKRRKLMDKGMLVHSSAHGTGLLLDEIYRDNKTTFIEPACVRVYVDGGVYECLSIDVLINYYLDSIRHASS